jgi:glycosyltransferase involved in cell wall biosynthesis
MKTLSHILFVGNYLQKHRGSVGVAQNIANWIREEEGLVILMVSEYENIILRFFDIVKTILRVKPQRIFVDTYSGKAFIITITAFVVSKITGSDVSCTLHGGRLFDFYQKYPRIMSAIFKRCKCYSPSLYLIDKFKDRNFDITYFPNPVRLEDFPYNRESVKPHTLLWVRGFTTIYNPDVPIRVLASLKPDFSDCSLTMVGPDRGLMDSCKKLAKELGVLDSVTFVGSVPNNELYKYYQSHEVYLNTTSYESFGVAVIEAASCGIPIVSNKVGELPYLWNDQKNIRLVEDNRIEQYVKCAQWIFENEEGAKELSDQARVVASKFDWYNVKPKWLKLLSAGLH